MKMNLVRAIRSLRFLGLITPAIPPAVPIGIGVTLLQPGLARAFDAAGAKNYALLWYDGVNQPKYKDLGDNGGDCTNFVSQAWHEGGRVPLSSDWYWVYENGRHTFSPAYVRVREFRSYWYEHGSSYVYVEGSAALGASYSPASPGDVYVFDSGSNSSGPDWAHAAIAFDWTNGYDRYAQHSPGKITDWRTWYWKRTAAERVNMDKGGHGIRIIRPSVRETGSNLSTGSERAGAHERASEAADGNDAASQQGRSAGGGGYGASFSGDARADLVARFGDGFRIWPTVRSSAGAFPWGSPEDAGSGWSGADPSAVYFADMNGDGKKDLVLREGDGFRIWRNANGGAGGAFPWADDFPVGSGWRAVDPNAIYFPDMNGDGRADLVLRDGDGFRIWHNVNGARWGQFPWGSDFPAGSGWRSVDPSSIYFPDMNGDGRADLALRDGDGFRVWHNLYGAKHGAFPWGGDFRVGSGWSSVDPSAIYLPDMNGDGKADLVQRHADGFRVWHNLHGAKHGAFPWGTDFQVGSGWSSADPNAIYFP